MRRKALVRRLVVVLALLFIPLGLLGIVSLMNAEFRDVRELRLAVDRSTATTFELQNLLIQHLNLETGQRGYIITGNERFLEPYRLGSARIESTLNKLSATSASEPNFRDGIPRLERLSRAKLLFSASTVERARGGDFAGARQMVEEGTGKRLMDALRAEVTRLTLIEQARLNGITKARDASRERIENTIYMVVAGFALLLACVGFVIILTIRERQRALARSRELAGRQQAILDGTVDGLLLLDEKGNIVEVNPSIERLFGYTADELVGKHNTFLMAEAPPMEASMAWLKRVGQAGRLGAGKREDFTGRHQDGHIIETDVAVSLIPGTEPRRYVAIIRDVTERKRVEEMKTEFVSTVSHELRTPLTSIGGSLGLLAAGAVGPLNEKAARLVNIAHSNCDRLIRLINDILDIEKIESGKMQFDMKRMRVGPWLDRVAGANAQFAASHGVEIAVHHAGWPQMIEGDADRLDQLLTNLVSNAIKHSPQGGKVELFAVESGQRLAIEVADRGGGIPEEFRSRIFGKFAMADGADNRARGGTGLGLSIAREIASKHGGTIGFSDRPGGGTVFRFELPLICEASLTPRVASPGTPAILHIDDDLDCLDVVASAFEGKATVVSVSSLKEAREALAKRAFVAAIVDVSIDPDSGLDLLPDLRAAKPDMPIVLFTAFDVSYTESNVEAVVIKSRSTVQELVATTLRLADGHIEASA